MKINRIHIENFGTLFSYDLELNGNLNCFCEINGYGKTTLGVFLKCMFYGFDKEKNKVSDRERTRYTPWQGGVYGGSVEFEVEETGYILERTFGQKASEDTFELWEKSTHFPSASYNAENIGKSLFGIDAASFTRTVLLSQNEYDFNSMNDIDAKIDDLVESKDDLNRFGQAVEALEEKISEISKKRSPFGKIEKNEEEITRLKQETRNHQLLLSEIEDVETSLKSVTGEVKRITEERSSLDEKIREVSFVKDLLAKRKEYRLYNENIENNSKEINHLVEYFNGLVPEKEDFEKLRRDVHELEPLNRIVNENSLTLEEEDNLAKLSQIFGGLMPDSEDIRQMQNLMNKITREKDELASLSLRDEEKILYEKEKDIFSIGFNTEENEELMSLIKGRRFEESKLLDSVRLSAEEGHELERLKLLYEKKEPDQELIHSYLEKLEDETLMNKLSSLLADEAVISSKSKYRFSPIGIVLMILLCIGGIVLLSFDYRTTGILLSALGLILFIAFSVVSTLSARKRNSEEMEKLEEKKKEISFEIQHIKETVHAFLNEYGHGQYEEAYGLRHLLEEIEDYHKLIEKKKDIENKHREFEEDIANIDERTREYLERYHVDFNESENLLHLSELESRYETYLKIKDKYGSERIAAMKKELAHDSSIMKEWFLKYNMADVNEKDYMARYTVLNRCITLYTDLTEKKTRGLKANEDGKESREEATAIFGKYGHNGEFDWNEKLTEMENNRLQYESLIEQNTNLENKKEEFKKNNPDITEIEINEESEHMSLEELSASSRRMLDHLDAYRTLEAEFKDKLDEKNEKLNEIMDKEGEIVRLSEENRALKEKLGVYEKTLSLLKNARDYLNSQYFAPVETALKEYFALLDQQSGIKVEIDADKNLYISVMGARRDIRSLSKGYADIVDLCFRMALIDAMYPFEKPMIILDDPFINLDEDKISLGLRFMKGLSEKYQILYLTCHKSRMPEVELGMESQEQ